MKFNDYETHKKKFYSNMVTSKSYIRHPTSDIRHQTFYIPHPTSVNIFFVFKPDENHISYSFKSY